MREDNFRQAGSLRPSALPNLSNPIRTRRDGIISKKSQNADPDAI